MSLRTCRSGCWTRAKMKLWRQPCALWTSMMSMPAASACFTDAANACLKSSISLRLISIRVGLSSLNAIAEGAKTFLGHPPTCASSQYRVCVGSAVRYGMGLRHTSLVAVALGLNQGATVLAFLPTCASWIQFSGLENGRIHRFSWVIRFGCLSTTHCLRAWCALLELRLWLLSLRGRVL